MRETLLISTGDQNRSIKIGDLSRYMALEDPKGTIKLENRKPNTNYVEKKYQNNMQ